MNTMNPVKPNAAAPTDKETNHRPVTLVLGEAEGGRISVTVTVVPTANVDAQGGVFVDFRLGTKDPADVPMVIDGADLHVSAIKKGDEAVAALAKKEAAAEHAAAHAPDAEGEAVHHEVAAAPEHIKRKPMEAKHPIISHQIAPGRLLTTGQAESFRADVTQPEAAPEGERWYVRGRFATTNSHDLKSAWTRV